MKKIKKYWEWIKKNKYSLVVLAIFVFEVFLRFYQIDLKSPFGYDQVDNAWTAKGIVMDHHLPLIGMPAKVNSGISIAPFYYYLLAIVYWITNLDPIAAGIAAGLVSIFNFWVLFYVSKKLFNKDVALIAIFIHTFTMRSIIFERIQVPINFLPSISLLIFYVLYRITQGDIKKIISLAILVGFSFSVHFTSIFYPIMIMLALPFFPKNKETLKYILISIPVFLFWIIPNIISQFQQKSYVSGMASYLETNYHGFHLRRVIQLTGDGLIQFEEYLSVHALAPLKYIAIPLFFLVYLYKSISRPKLIFCYLVSVWFIVPWFAFATYSGEISDYYFSINRFLALLIISYFIARVWMIKNIIPKLAVSFILIYIAYFNLMNFFPYKDTGLFERENAVLTKIKNGEKIKFQGGVPESYLYYYFLRQKGIKVY